TAVVVTLMLTLFASWAWGFTLNRVSLFALIFSIGILVDDAIVVVENIHRHMSMGGENNLLKVIPRAVDEVGGPTILATFTVIAALLPMAFVTGLMGPYMSPIPINASMGMLISLVIAFVVTPWLSNVVFSRRQHHTDAEDETAMLGFFQKVIGPLLDDEKGRQRRRKLWISVVVLLLLSVSLVMFKMVILKMLPFDNKSEFQIVVDMPEGTPLEVTQRVLKSLGRVLIDIDEVHDYQIYSGTASPINFNGLVRQYYLREGSHLGDIQVNLVDKTERGRTSHEIAQQVREDLMPIARDFNANVKVVEVPPGPPVFSPIVVEIYGLDYSEQSVLAIDIRDRFEHTASMVDVDDTVEDLSLRYIIHIDRQRAAHFGIDQNQLSQLIATALGGEDVSYLHGANVKYPVPIRVILPVAERDSLDAVLAMKVRSRDGSMVSLLDLVFIQQKPLERAIHHKDLLPVVYVTGDVTGDIDSPLYGMFALAADIRDDPVLQDVQQSFINPPDNPYRPTIKWDGEWQVTYETFRDMGIAYSVGLLLIYFLVVAQFRSYMVPLVIMAPIPLTVIGVMPGHALFGMQFTATSMIGMIALAGIIVRNSILLVDFINEETRKGLPFKEAVIRSGAIRAKPIILTGAAAMMGAFFILNDPIFGGLAVSLISGIFVSTILTLVVIPVLYYAAMHKRMAFE
ncbi:MAG: efflux RND transporter permease subunit, partial [Gammaproteobacteria bacterium]|nr:efflux RND transporter permease subunit [Gammaproteobacteria bacterium]